MCTKYPVSHVVCVNLTWLIPLFLFSVGVSLVSFFQTWGDRCGMLDVCDAGLEELTLNLASLAFPKSGFHMITKRGWDYQKCLSSLCAQPLFIFWGLVNLGPWINEMLSKRKPRLVNIPPDPMRIVCPASPLISCVALVQRPQKFTTIPSAVKDVYWEASLC